MSHCRKVSWQFSCSLTNTEIHYATKKTNFCQLSQDEVIWNVARFICNSWISCNISHFLHYNRALNNSKVVLWPCLQNNPSKPGHQNSCSGFFGTALTLPPSANAVLSSVASMPADSIAGMIYWRWADKQWSDFMPFLLQSSQLTRMWDRHQSILVVYPSIHPCLFQSWWLGFYTGGRAVICC